jgi:hypothetical protein
MPPIRNEEFTPEEFSFFDKSPLESAYVETFIYAPSSREEDELGRLYIVAEISSNKTKKENAEFVSKLVGIIKNEFYKNTIISQLSALRFSLKRANRFLEEEKARKSSSANLKIKILVAALKENILHFAKLGDIETMILRGNNLQQVADLSSSTIKQNVTFENIVSGEILKTDKIVLATSQIHKISENIIIQKLNERNLTKYLKNDNSGFKTLGLITLYPKDFQDSKKELPSLKYNTNKINIATLATKKFQKIHPAIKKIPKIQAIAVVFIIAICITAIMVVAFKLRQDTAQAKNEANTLVNEILDLKEKTFAMIELKNEQEAEELLKSAQEKITRLEELGYFKTTRFELASELEKIAKTLNKIENILNLRTVFSIESGTKELNPNEISAGKNKIMAFGEDLYYEYDLNRNTGSTHTLGAGIKIASILPKPGNQEKNLFVTQNKITDGDSDLWIKPAGRTGAEIIQAEIYNNAFYILEDDSMIYKLPLETSSSTMSVGNLSLWINTTESANQGQISAFAVEGSIFALTDPFDENKISKTIVEMQNGNRKNSVEIREGLSKIFTSQSLQNIYALSPTEGIIIMLDKNLNIKKRLSHQELKEAKSFFVNSQERIIYFLKGKTVYSFEI